MALGAVIVGLAVGGCGSSAGPATPEVQQRMSSLFKLYQAYVAKNRTGPPSEAALREFGQKLSPADREAYGTGDDFENIFVSPRDNQKFVVKYNVKLDPGQNRAIIWEATSQDGLRYVALSVGYVEKYDDETLRGYQK